MALVTGRNVQQIMTMLLEALKKESETWRPCSFRTSSIQVDAICAQDRSHAVEWLMMLNDFYGFYPETLFLSVSILDRFLNSVKAQPKYLKCIAVTCFYLGAKVTEEDELIPNTGDLMRESMCGCSISEIHRMEICILNKFGWDLRVSTPLDFLYLYHSLLVSKCPDLLSGFPMLSPSDHLHHITQTLEQCLLHHQLAGFTPSTVALTVLSLDLEVFCPYWFNVTIALQSIAQISQMDLVSCRDLVLQCLNCGPRVEPTWCVSPFQWYPTKGMTEEETDDMYDGIKRLYGEEINDVAVVLFTCGSEAMHMTSRSLRKPAVAT